jgi:hypothetical protein
MSRRVYAKAALLKPGDVVMTWRLTRYQDVIVDRVELTPDRMGGRTGAYPECVARVFAPDKEHPFFHGAANHDFRLRERAA